MAEWRRDATTPTGDDLPEASMTDTPARQTLASPGTPPHAEASAGPLRGLRVLDFTTLLPGPLATLLLADAGATVLKIEPPGGDPLRHQGPYDVHGASVVFQLLNRGKHLRTLDLKSPAGQAEALRLARSADVLVEQFRPGVMERLGLGPAALVALNPRLVYCSITGYGQSGPNARRAGHDLNYVADAGLLLNTVGRDAAPVLPATQVADIGGGSWPAVINILLALLARERDGRGCRLDISMADNVWPFQLTALATLWARGVAPAAGLEPLTGGLSRYHLYETRDGRWLALGALEDRFFARFAEIAGLRDAAGGHGGPSREQVARRIREQSAGEWLRLCEGEDVCIALVRDVGEAVGAATLTSVRAFAERSTTGAAAPPALPLPLDAGLRARRLTTLAPPDGTDDADWGSA
jgi:crotonobetainyl-CoA:carnitine CoA-transferase CaiB-like acyl-CoA transferase